MIKKFLQSIKEGNRKRQIEQKVDAINDMFYLSMRKGGIYIMCDRTAICQVNMESKADEIMKMVEGMKRSAMLYSIGSEEANS